MVYLDSVRSKFHIKGIMTLIYDGVNLDVSSSGSFIDGVSMDTEISVPVSYIMDIFTSAYLVEKSIEGFLELETAVTRSLPKLNLIEEQFSIRFLQLDHLLSHISGLAPVRSRRDVIRGTKVVSVKRPTELIPLVDYFQHPITQLQSPGNVVVQNPMDYGLAARLIEEMTGTNFSLEMTSYLAEHGINHNPYDNQFETGYIQKKRKHSRYKKADKEYFHLYPSLMGRLTPRELIEGLYSILYTSDNADEVREKMFSPRHHPYRYADTVCLPFRQREGIDSYQYSAQAHGFTLNLIVHPPTKTIAVTIINKSSPQSLYHSGKILRRELTRFGIQGFNSYPDPKNELTNDQKDVITSRYMSYRHSFLVYYFNFTLGGGLQIKERKKQLYLTNLPNGVYSQATRMSFRYALRPIFEENDRLVLAYDDGLYISKIVVPSSRKSATIYAEIDTGSTLYFKSFQSYIFLINLRQTWDYYLAYKVFPIVNRFLHTIGSSIRNLFGHKVTPQPKEMPHQGHTLPPAKERSSSRVDVKTTTVKKREVIPPNEIYSETEITSEIDVSRSETKEKISESDKTAPSLPTRPGGMRPSRLGSILYYSRISLELLLIYLPFLIIRGLFRTLRSLPSLIKNTIVFFIPFVRRFFHDSRLLISVSFKKIVGEIQPPNVKAGFMSYLMYYVKSFYRKLMNLIVKHDPIKAKAILMKEKHYTTSYYTRIRKIKIYNQKYPRQISFDLRGVRNFVVFGRYHFNKVNTPIKLSERQKSALVAVFGPIVTKFQVLISYIKYADKKGKHDRIQRQRELLERQNLMKLDLPKKYAKYEGLLIDNQIITYDQLADCTVRKLVGIGGIGSETAEDLIDLAKTKVER